MRNWVWGIVALACVGAVMATASSTALARSCGAGYVHAVIGGAQKCLRRGEYCSHAEGRQYHRYGYDCVRVSGTYRLEPRD